MTNHIQITIDKLSDGGVILCPTDTIWGLGCDPFNESAVNKIYDIKNRDRSKSLIILVSDIDMLKTYVPHIHPRIETLLFFHIRPLTIIYDKPINLPDWLVADDCSIAIRLVKDSFIKETIKLFGRPLVSTSANIQGDETPEEFDDVTSSILRNVDYIVPQNFENKVTRGASVIVKYNLDGEIELVR